MYFLIEINKKKNILFERDNISQIFISKVIEKDLVKSLVYKEGVITNSLYISPYSLGRVTFK